MKKVQITKIKKKTDQNEQDVMYCLQKNLIKMQNIN